MSKYIKVTDVELGGSVKIGDIELSNTDLADLIEGGSGSGAGLALGVTSTTAYRGDHGLTAYNHSQEAHAPSDAQKNSDITKTEIEAKLTGEISSHTHTDSGGFANPMTTAGDIIVGSTDGAPARLAKGADGKVLGVESGAVAWVTPTGGVGNLPMLFALPSKLEGDPALHFAIEFHETDDYSGTAVYSIDTAVSQTGIKVFDGSAWVAFPAGGAGTIFYGNQIKIEYNEAMGGTPKNVRYKLYLKDDDPTAQPWKYTAYPAVGGADGGGGVDGADGVDGNINAIVSATPPENPGNGTIWIEA